MTYEIERLKFFGDLWDLKIFLGLKDLFERA